MSWRTTLDVRVTIFIGSRPGIPSYEASLGLFDYNAIIASHHRAIAIWRELGNVAKVSLNYRLLSRLHWRRGEGAEARNFADLAVEEVEGTGPGPELALAMAFSTRSQLNMLHYRFAEAIDWGWRAIRLADELGVVETRVHALNNVGTAMLFDARSGGREVMEEGLALALQYGFHDHAARAYTNFAEHAVVSKDFELAERLLAEGIACAARRGTTSIHRHSICSGGRRSCAWSRAGFARPRRLRRASSAWSGCRSLELAGEPAKAAAE